MKISRNDRLKNARKWVKQNAVKVASFEVADASMISLGEKISISIPDNRILMRFWHFITSRKPPMVKKIYTVRDIKSGGIEAVTSISKV